MVLIGCAAFRLPANLNSDNASAHEPPSPARPMRKRDWTKARRARRHRASSFDGAAAIPHSQRLHSALGISPPNRQSAKPLNPVSTKSQEGHFRILGVRGLNLSICAKLLPTQGLPPIF